MPSAFYTENELMELGVSTFGANVKISRQALVIGWDKLSFGENVRVDAFTCLLASKGYITFGSNIHVSTHCHLNGGGGIDIHDFVQIATGSRLISASDDMSGEWLVGPCVPKELTNVKRAAIALHPHVVLCANSTVLPGIEMGEGSLLAAHGLLMESCPDCAIMVGAPARSKKMRSARFLELASKLRVARIEDEPC